MNNTRIESDSMGQVRVAHDKLWGGANPTFAGAFSNRTRAICLVGICDSRLGLGEKSRRAVQPRIGANASRDCRCNRDRV